MYYYSNQEIKSNLLISKVFFEKNLIQTKNSRKSKLKSNKLNKKEGLQSHCFFIQEEE